MKEPVKLIDSKDAAIWRGNVFRVKGKYPYEECVDFMVFETLSEESPYGLMVTSGYKAGLILVYLPGESSHPVGGLDKGWIVANWSKWIYPDCSVTDVCLLDGYVVG